MAFNLITAFSALVTKPSAFLASFDFIEWIGNLMMAAWAGIVEFLYFIVKWMLYFTDIIFIYLQQLAGLNIDTSSVGAMFSQDSDVVFNMLISNSESVTIIIRNLIIIAIVLLLVFSIFAIVKSQFLTKNGEEPTPVGQIMKNLLKSLLMLFLTPLLALMGIAATNVLLKSLYAATNPSNSSSIGTRIFAAASSQANIYRVYASNGNRIPITYDFSEYEAIIDTYLSGENIVDSKFGEYVTSSESVIYPTYTMFQDKTFDKFYDLRVEDTTNLEAYHSVFDKKIGLSESDPLAEYKRIRAYLEEYYVMADVIEWAIETANPLYMKTIQQVLQSLVDLPNDNGKTLFNAMVARYGIELYKSNNLTSPVVPGDTQTLFDVFKAKEYQVIRFSNNYNSVTEEGEIGGRQQIQYNHIINTYDELDGAVFIMAGESTIEIDGATYTYYTPLSIGYDANHSGSFKSEYIQRDQMVAAKGIFDTQIGNQYPTAIRLSADKTEIQFYRDTIEISFLGEDSKFARLDHTEDGSNNVFNKIVKFIKALLNPLSLVPEIFVDQESVDMYYVKVSKNVNTLDNAKLHIGYLFTDILTSQISGNIYGLDLDNLFLASKINILVLMFATAALMRTCFLGVFALIRRSYELFMLFLYYPVGIATMPIDPEGDGRFKTWMKMFMDKLFMTYGLILGLNFVILLFPVIESITFITPENITQNVAAMRVATIVGGDLISVDTKAKLFNSLLAIVAELILFSMLTGPDDKKGGGKNKDENSIIYLIQKIANPETTGTIYDSNAGGEMIKVTKQMTLVAGKAAAVAIFKVPEQVLDFVLPSPEDIKPPGEALMQEVKNKAAMKSAKAGQKNAVNDLKGSLANGDANDIKAKMKGVNDAQGAVGKAASNEVGKDKSKEQKKKE